MYVNNKGQNVPPKQNEPHLIEQNGQPSGGQHSTMVCIHASGASYPMFDSKHSQKILVKDDAEVNQWYCLEGSGQRHVNVY